MHRHLVILSIVLAVTSGPPRVFSAASGCDDAIVSSVSSQCERLDHVRGLDEFLQFYANLEHLNERCLKLKSPLETPGESSQAAENSCKSKQVVFYQVRQIARLARRWTDPSERVCTIEFAMQIYHLDNQLRALSKDSLAPRILRLLANSVAWKCRFTLVKRLASIERRAPDSHKFIQLIVGMITVGKGSLDNLKSLERLEQFVPVLERELTTRTLGVGASNSLGRDGFELKSTNGQRMSYDALKMSCKTLKPYHVNVFGSLGLLASLGYADPAGALDESNQARQQLKPAESRADRLLTQRWLLSALLCQNLRNVLKMQSVTSEGKALARFKIMDTQEPDVSTDDETDRTFAEYQLPESVPQEVVSVVTSQDHQIAGLFATYEFEASEEIAMRKLHLLNGPNYALANSIGTYLDLSKPTGRLEAVEQMVGLKLEMDSANDEDDEDEDEDEEE